MKSLNFLINLSLFGFLLILIASFNACIMEQKKPVDNQPGTQLNPDAPNETELLGQLVGTWSIEQSFINNDGTWSDNKRKAKWKWYYILYGHAIQDDWITFDSLDNEIVTGTNIRIYNPEEKQWYMAWIDKTNRRLATFTAVNDSGKVIMDGTNAKRRHIKNTFFNISENEFDWKQEWTFDEGKSWIVVSKIHGVRI
jgi:hypothetical protein